MIFKRPKTSNNFGFCSSTSKRFFEWEENDEGKQRKDEDYEDVWEELLADPLYFWYLMQIVELFENREYED